MDFTDDVIPLFVELQSPGSSCRPDIILDPRLGAVEVDYPEAFLANEVNTISASVNEGMGVTFAFAVSTYRRSYIRIYGVFFYVHQSTTSS